MEKQLDLTPAEASFLSQQGIEVGEFLRELRIDPCTFATEEGFEVFATSGQVKLGAKALSFDDIIIVK